MGEAVGDGVKELIAVEVAVGVGVEVEVALGFVISVLVGVRGVDKEIVVFELQDTIKKGISQRNNNEAFTLNLFGVTSPNL